MVRRPTFPPGAWPARMPVEMAAGYCGERSAEAFLSRVGKEYPEPVIKAGRRQLWFKDDLDSAIGVGHAIVLDVAEAALAASPIHEVRATSAERRYDPRQPDPTKTPLKAPSRRVSGGEA
jgi:hypothetical protein